MEEENKLIQVLGYITSVATKKTEELKITIETQENLTGETKAVIFDYQNKPGWFCFLASPDKKIDPLDIDLKPLPAMEKNEKTLSQRLRAVLHVYYKQCEKEFKTKGFKTADEHYKYYMEHWINIIKEKLDE